jgi:hypothetical protein
MCLEMKEHIKSKDKMIDFIWKIIKTTNDQ